MNGSQMVRAAGAVVGPAGRCAPGGDATAKARAGISPGRPWVRFPGSYTGWQGADGAADDAAASPGVVVVVVVVIVVGFFDYDND
ncbi:hypothetical protein, partial [uncultured Thiodictyon sp.]|uniref:hypothetical protein n=1 Tax=uncultured Thiodictyon sp. TaxID=1846217 RepID=UPI0025F49B59